MLEKKINDVTSDRLREMSTRMTDSLMDESHIVNRMDDLESHNDNLDSSAESNEIRKQKGEIEQSMIFQNEKDSINFEGQRG